LYLRSSATGLDPLPNKEAIHLLDRSLDLDPGFAPAWLALALRLRFDNLLSDGAEGGYPRAVEAVERAVTLDPELFPARVEQIKMSVEMGRHAEAYRAASDLIDQRPSSAAAHAALAYALRYGGEVEASARACRLAMSLDPEGLFIRSCMWSLTHTADFEGTLEMLAGASELQIIDSLRADVLMRMGEDARALEAMAEIGDEFAGIDLQRGCIQDPRPAGLEQIVADHELEYAGWGDPEALYWFAALMARCDLPDTAFRFLELHRPLLLCDRGGARQRPAVDFAAIRSPLCRATHPRHRVP